LHHNFCGNPLQPFKRIKVRQLWDLGRILVKYPVSTIQLLQMQASVYRLRDRGIKLPRPSSPQSGDVQLAKIDRRDLRYLQARLLDGDLDVLPPLHKAVITRVSNNGMVIHGEEMASRKPSSTKTRVSSYRQTWWALVQCEAPSGIDLLEEIANGEDPSDYLSDHSDIPPPWQRACEPGGRDPR
jgi:hypothetical protein